MQHMSNSFLEADRVSAKALNQITKPHKRKCLVLLRSAKKTKKILKKTDRGEEPKCMHLADNI